MTIDILTIYYNQTEDIYETVKVAKEKTLYSVWVDNKLGGAFLLKNKDTDYWINDNKAMYICHLVTKEKGKRFLRLDCQESNLKLNKYYEKHCLGGPMELRESISNRRSIRKFDTRKIDNKMIEEIIYYGSLAPSGKNRQPWRFVVIQDNIKLKSKIADIMIEKAKEKIKKGESPGSIKNTAQIIKQAPVFIAVFNTWNNKIINANLQSIGACIENICLTATDMSLGSLWICDIDCAFKEIEELLDIKDISLVAGISLGYQLENPNARPRLSTKKLIDWR